MINHGDLQKGMVVVGGMDAMYSKIWVNHAYMERGVYRDDRVVRQTRWSGTHGDLK